MTCSDGQGATYLHVLFIMGWVVFHARQHVMPAKSSDMRCKVFGENIRELVL